MSLLFPFAFNATFDTAVKDWKAQDLIDLACAQAEPAALVSWGFPATDYEEQRRNGHDAVPSAAMGCMDGSIFLFQAQVPLIRTTSPQESPRNDERSTPSEYSQARRASSPFLRSHLASASRSSSPSSIRSSVAPFAVSSRSRITSGISLEKVEAPKNYVDFDDEPEKLKDMLKGKNPRERSSLEGKASPAKSSGSEKDRSGSSSWSPSRIPSSRKNTPSSRHDRTPSSGSISGSRPGSPISGPPLSYEPSSSAPRLTLKAHIFPPEFGLGKAIADLQVLADNRYLVCLQESGYISIFSTKDGFCVTTADLSKDILAPPTGTGRQAPTENVWRWKRLSVVRSAESIVILAVANSDTSSGPPSFDASEAGASAMTRLAVLEFSDPNDHGLSDPLLEKVGDWCTDDPSSICILYSDTDEYLSLLYVDGSGHLVKQPIRLLARAALLVPDVSDAETNEAIYLNLPNPFKVFKARSTDSLPVIESDKAYGRIEVGQQSDLGDLSMSGCVEGIRTCNSDGEVRGIMWTDEELAVFEIRDGRARRLFTASLSAIEDVEWISRDAYSVFSLDSISTFALCAVDANNDDIPEYENRAAPANFQPRLVANTAFPEHDCLSSPSTRLSLLTRIDKKGRRQFELFERDGAVTATRRHRILWKSHQSKRASLDNPARITCILPAELSVFVLGCYDGRIRRSSLTKLARNSVDPSAAASNIPLNGFITSLHLIASTSNGDDIIVGGVDDGSVAFWSYRDLTLRACCTVFIDQLKHVTQTHDESQSSLRGCLLCVSQEGTIAVVSTESFDVMYVVPGAVAPLTRLFVGGDHLLLLYSDGRARLWDTKTSEFWRSMNQEKAIEIQTEEKFSELSLEGLASTKTDLRSMSEVYCGPDSATSILADVSATLDGTLLSKHVNPERQAAELEESRILLSILLTPGLNESVDSLCHQQLGIEFTDVSVGYSRRMSSALACKYQPQDPWCISAEVSAARLLGIVISLRNLARFEKLRPDVNTVLTYYATSLSSVMGSSYEPPSLVYLSVRWLESHPEERAAVEMLLDAALPQLTNQETSNLIEKWQHSLPCIQPDAMKQSRSAASALLLCGRIASAKYSLLAPSALSDIAKSITLYLHGGSPIYMALAIDLCARGFDVWQQYVDAMDLLRSLFMLATNVRKHQISVHNSGVQARTAVLKIAASNSPLFITTLSLDILHPRSLEHRKSVMQLVAFLIRKQPLVLYPNLPRLLEAVVKSLDPSNTTGRDAILNDATEILGYVVKTYPTVDFHMASQRLVVGTSEGAAIMYDLKTATRLYVLEGHKKRIVACSLSPDGRRLVTVSLEEGTVLVWKVGSSFASFFIPGAPPHQGHSGSEPFKTLPFNVGDEANMSISATLEFIRFEWTSDRNVKLRIRDSTLTFAT